jgi:hypothetical protein
MVSPPCLGRKGCGCGSRFNGLCGTWELNQPPRRRTFRWHSAAPEIVRAYRSPLGQLPFRLPTGILLICGKADLLEKAAKGSQMGHSFAYQFPRSGERRTQGPYNSSVRRIALCAGTSPARSAEIWLVIRPHKSTRVRGNAEFIGAICPPGMLPWSCPRVNHSHKFFPLDSGSNFVHAELTSHPAAPPVSAK